MRNHLHVKPAAALLLTAVFLCLCGFAAAETTAHEHKWGNKTLIRAATCSSRAIYQYTCEVCNEKKEQAEGEIDPMGHDYGPWVVIHAATATSDGLEQKECSLCHLSAQRTIPALHAQTETEHTWGEGVKISDATCGTPAIYEYTCQTCGAKKHDFVGGLAEHEWGEWIVDVEATPTTVGKQHRICKLGHREDMEIISLSIQHAQESDHTWVKTQTVSPKTCTHGEWCQYTCSVCNAIKMEYDGSPDPSAHIWSNWMVQTAPTATEPGVEVRYCMENMEHKETRPIPALGGEGTPAPTAEPQPTAEVKPTTAPTAEVKPTAAPTAEVKPTAAPTAEAKPTTAPTAEVKPTAAPTEASAHTHVWDNRTQVKEATCSAPAQYRYTCTVCGVEKVESEGAVNPDHHELQWRIPREATTEAEGIRQEECILCGRVFRVFKIPRIVQTLTIDEAHFPDPAFRQFVQTQYDKNHDWTLTADETDMVWIMVCREMGIRSLTGIEYFPGLLYLDCGVNELTELNLSNNERLKSLIASFNHLTELNISQNPDLCQILREGQKTVSEEDNSVSYALNEFTLCVDADTNLILE